MKFSRFKYEETISDMKQEKAYLELRIEQLGKEVEQYKESTHEQRIRALDLKYELREVCGLVGDGSI